MTAPAGHRLTRNILIGLGAGALVGLLLYLVAPPADGNWSEVYLADGLFAVVGQAFVALLRVLVVPLVFVSLVCGTAALDDVAKLGRVGLKTVGLYLLTTAIAISLALTAAVLIKPGVGFGLETDLAFEAREAPSLVEVLVGIFPRNVIDAMASGNMLQIIVFAILFGLACTLAGAPGKRVLSVFEDLNAVIMRLVWIIMAVAPYGVFALIARTIATQGFDAFGPLLSYFFLVFGVLILHALLDRARIIDIGQHGQLAHGTGLGRGECDFWNDGNFHGSSLC